LANDLRQKIEGGEDFARLAEEFSDDPGSAAKGGDLGWFGKGVMIKEFEDAAFTLPLAQVSEPISTTFGYHLIEVTEKDPNRPKDESTLSQERGQAFQEWLQEQTANSKIERPSDLANLLPSGL
jgi:foldase protein PrsA